MTSLRLDTASGSLRVIVDSDGVGDWCQVHLVGPTADRPLGAERRAYLVARLTAFLADPTPGLRWVFSLAERHTSAYGEHAADHVMLHLQDASATWIGSLHLTTHDRDAWLQLLDRPR